MQRFLAFSGVALAVMMGAARAGVVITAQTDSGGDKSHADTIYLEPDRMRQNAGSGAEMIYRADLKKVWMVHDADHTYREMDPESMQAMRTQMEAAMAQMRERMQSMPEEQRKRMESLMGSADKAPPKPPSYEKAGPPKKIGQWTCTPYRVQDGTSGNEEFCVARMSDVGLKPADLQAFESLGKFMQQMMPTGAGAAARPVALDIAGLSKAVGYDAVPIQMSRLGDDGKVEYQTTVTKVERQSIAANLFEVPAGYAKQAMPMMPGARQQ